MSEICADREARLMALLYEDGDEAERAATRAHLAECADCRTELEELADTREFLSEWPNVSNFPRMVYVNERPAGVLDRIGRWASGLRPGGWLAPAAAAALTVIVLVGAVAALDPHVSPEGSVRLGLLAEETAMTAAADLPVTQEELQTSLAEMTGYFERLLEDRSARERQLLLTAIDERMQEQGLSMSRELRGAVNAAFEDLEGQHDSDLGLVFSAIDEMGVMTSAELRRMNAILGSLAMAGPGN